MARPRSQLHDILKEIAGTHNVYFQPPASLTMTYPCIVYKRDNADIDFSDDIPYRAAMKYMITVIDQSPDSDILDDLAALPSCRHNRNYAIDKLNHDVYTLYF